MPYQISQEIGVEGLKGVTLSRQGMGIHHFLIFVWSCHFDNVTFRSLSLRKNGNSLQKPELTLNELSSIIE